MRLNSVRSWRKALLLRQPMKTGHVILLQDIHSSTSLFWLFPSIPVPSVSLYFTLWIFKDETFIIWVSVTDFLLHTKSQPTQSRFCVHNHHQTLKKSQTFPFIDSSTSILCSIKANNYIFPTILTPPKPNMCHGPGRGRAKSTDANWV